MTQELINTLHLSEIEDHREITQVLLTHFSEASTIDIGKHKYQKRGQENFMIVSLNKENKISNVELSEGFPKEELDHISSTIQEKLVDNQVIKIGQLVAFSGEKITTHFNYKDMFQILPINSEAPHLDQAWGDHPFLLQFKYTGCSDVMLDNLRRARKGNVLVRILNAILNPWVSSVLQFAEFSWVYGDPPDMTSRWSQHGYAG
ncbi:MAG TPA: hypothetical protein VLI92_01350, partial [Candidatus Saccharimonadales bacterium]|nr:hypothetical protein [Candidatus Saccharimonadales bacterium]